MNNQFEAAIASLNSAQKQAVDTIDGPLLVVAGPGTGKTQILSLRVANILSRTDTDPSSILCLTFTNYAATNMRERLTNLVGPSARNVVVRTFHSFAADVMQSYPDYFWEGARLGIVPDAVQLEIIESLISRLPLDNPLSAKFGGAYTAINDIKESLKLSKEAGLTPDKLKAMIDVNIKYIDVIEDNLIDICSSTLSIKKLDELQEQVMQLEDQNISEAVYPLSSLSDSIKTSLKIAIESDKAIGKTTNTGKWKRRWVQTIKGKKSMFDERKRNLWWLNLSEVYESYRQHLHSRGYYDYSDMLVEVISVLDSNPELLSEIQERYLYVLIDEFQDTNAAQIRLAHLVASSYAAENKPNIMAVGDDDQSIFAFNGAELNNMLNFRKNYPTSQTIILTDNYRSTSEILSTSSSIIEQAEQRLVNYSPDLVKDLVAKSTVKQGNIEHHRFPTQEHELYLIADNIKDSWDSGEYQSVAVLARSHASLRQMSYYLNSNNVPIAYENQNNILDLELVQQIELISQIVEGIANGNKKLVDYNLRLMLQHPAWKIDPLKLWSLATKNLKDRIGWLDSLASEEDAELMSIGNWLLWLSSEAIYQPLVVSLEYIIGLRAGSHLTSPLRNYFMDNKDLSSAYIESLSGLNTMNNLVKEFVNNSSTVPKLSDFNRFMNLNRQLDRRVPNETWFVTSEKAVQLMTVHKSKGLEFDKVYLLNVVENDWQPRRAGRKPPANLPLQPYGEHFDDYARLAYVASTRAKSSFIVSSYEIDSGGQRKLASPLFSELKLIQHGAENESISSKISILESSFAWPQLETSDRYTLLSPLIKKYKLSATGLIRFLDLTTGGPEHFLQRELLRLPEMTTANIAYGTAMHKALQVANNLENNKLSLEKVYEAYATSLSAQNIPTETSERYLPHGKQILDNLFNNLDFRLPKGGQAEVIINECYLDNIPLIGALDHVYIDNDTVVISDYKTGGPVSSFDTKNQTKLVKAWRHKTQLLFYCLLVKNSQRYKNIKNIKAQMIYLEAETGKELILQLEPTAAELDQTRKLINAVWKRIEELDFYGYEKYEPSMSGMDEFIKDLLQ